MNPKHDAAMKELMTHTQGEPLKDSFRVKVNWREKGHTLPDTFCILEDVTSEQLAMPETWLLAMAGGAGGVYDVDIFPMSDTRKRISDGFTVSMNVDRSPKSCPAFDFAAIRGKDYRGPTKVTLPKEAKVEDEALRVSTPPAARAPLTAVGSDARETDLQRRETALLVQESEARILAAIKPAQAPAVDSSKGNFAEIGGLLIGFLKEQGEARRADMREAAAERQRQDDRAREERTRQDQRDRDERTAAEKRQQDMLVALQPKPNPIFDALLQKALNRDDSAPMKAQAEVMATVTGAMVQLMHTQAEINQLNAPQEESPLMKLLTKGIDALVAINTGAPMPEDGALADGDEAAAALPEGEQQPENEDPPLAVLERALRQMKPGPEIAELFCAAMRDPEFRALKNKFPTWPAFIDSRMGPWVAKDKTKREPYISDVIVNHAFPMAVQRKLLNPPGAKPQQPAAAPTPNGKKKHGQGPKPATKSEPEDAVIVEEKKAEPPKPEAKASA